MFTQPGQCQLCVATWLLLLLYRSPLQLGLSRSIAAIKQILGRSSRLTGSCPDPGVLILFITLLGCREACQSTVAVKQILGLHVCGCMCMCLFITLRALFPIQPRLGSIELPVFHMQACTCSFRHLQRGHIVSWIQLFVALAIASSHQPRPCFLARWAGMSNFLYRTTLFFNRMGRHVHLAV